MRVLLIPLILWAVASVSVESRPQPLPQDDDAFVNNGAASSTSNLGVKKDLSQGDQGDESKSSGLGETEKRTETSEDTTTLVPDPAGKTTDKPTEPLTEETTVEPTEPPTEEPTIGPTEEPTVEPTGEPTSEAPSNATSTTTEYTTEPTAAPSHHDKRSFDGWSFFGGILLTLGVMTVAMVGFRYYKARTGGGSVGYNRAPDI